MVVLGVQLYPSEVGHLTTDCLVLPGVLSKSPRRQSPGGNIKVLDNGDTGEFGGSVTEGASNCSQLCCWVCKEATSTCSSLEESSSATFSGVLLLIEASVPVLVSTVLTYKHTAGQAVQPG